MAAAPLRLLIIARDGLPRIQQGLKDIRAQLSRRRGVKVVDVLTAAELEQIDVPADLALVLGGDGAILRACRLMGSRQIPILGLNFGRLGFLADLSPDDFQKLIPDLAARKYQVVKHLMFECVHRQQNGTQLSYLGLNEAAVLSGGSLRMIDVELCIDGEAVTTFSGDGVIISTPVGSTAHNLSAGGPILRQDLRAFVVTPICPHTLTIRPIVDRADAAFVLTAARVPDGAMLVVDGQVKVPFRSGETVTIRQASVDFQLVRVTGHSFYRTLHRKLGWHGQPRYQRD